ncbi:aldose epimerase family protein [Haloferula sargassicola]|uniref:Aldose 1-epimerase n=1 Tax=Haloferula sargassicola TaxID=490096 RepID=A0ABP9URA6_9BACT
MSSTGIASSTHLRSFGKLSDGLEAKLVTLRNSHGLTASITNFGAALVGVLTPDRDGEFADITLGYDTAAGYETDSNPYLGATVGRFGNRIASGTLTIDGQFHQLATNNEPGGIPCHLHGGTVGFSRRLWDILEASETRVVLRYDSPDGDEGYPGALTATVTYELSDENELIWEATATTTRITIVNLVHHSYWNLSGNPEKDILDHELRLAASRYLPTDDGLIPTGELKRVEGTPLDFREARRIGDRINEDHPCLKRASGYDHAWILDKACGGNPVFAAEVHHPATGRTIEIFTNQPAIQVYSGNFLSAECFRLPHQGGKGGIAYPFRSGLCLETENYPDAPNKPHFPSPLLHPGETYRHIEVHRFSVK